MDAQLSNIIEQPLHPKQGEAFLTWATEVLYGGAAGGGKSHLMRVAAIAWCMDIPGLQVYLFRRTFPDLHLNHMTGPTSFDNLLAPWLDSKWVRYNGRNNEYTFWNGSCIHLCHCQYEKDVNNYWGAEIHVLMIDEITHWLRTMYTYLRGRVRLGGLKVPKKYAGMFPRVLVSGNPGGIGHNWVKQDFVDFGLPLQIQRTPKSEGGMLRQYIPARLDDNPTMLENDPDYADRLSGLGNPALVKAMLAGDWNIVAGGMFDDVWDEDTHFIEPFAIPPSWRIDRAYDWGSSKPFSVGWWAEADGSPAWLASGHKWHFPKGTLFRIAEWYGWNGRANEGLKMSDSGIAEGIVAREKQLGIFRRCKAGPADSSIFDLNGNGDSPALTMERNGVRFLPADKSPGSRVRRWSLIRDRLMASLHDDREKPGMYIFNTCAQFKRTFPVLPRDQLKPDDVDTDAEDHIADETGYRVLAAGDREAMAIAMGATTNG